MKSIDTTDAILRKYDAQILQHEAQGFLNILRKSLLCAGCASFEGFLRHYPLFIEGLDRKVHRAQMALRNGARLSEKRETYEEIKRQLGDTYDVSLGDWLVDLTREINEEKDCTHFLAELGRSERGKRIKQIKKENKQNQAGIKICLQEK